VTKVPEKPAGRRTPPWGRIRRAERRRPRREEATGARPEWATLEEFARLRIQGWLQDPLEEEITELLGRRKSERRAAVDAEAGYRNEMGSGGGWR
jgi:hypothetical protein